MFEMADVTIIRGQKTAVLVRLKWVLVRHWQLLSNAPQWNFLGPFWVLERLSPLHYICCSPAGIQ